jgi:hypothetical protein
MKIAILVNFLRMLYSGSKLLAHRFALGNILYTSGLYFDETAYNYLNMLTICGEQHVDTTFEYVCVHKFCENNGNEQLQQFEITFGLTYDIHYPTT